MANIKPEAYEYASPLDQSTWTLPSNLTADTASAWETDALAKQKLEQQALMQSAKSQSAAGLAQARSGLAMRGGATSGASERLAQTGFRNQLGAQQEVGLAGATARAGINAQAGDLASTENQYNIGNILNQSQLANTAGQDAYNTEMAGWAGKEYADATRSSAEASAASSGLFGCFITTACCELLGLPDDNNILNTFREFRDNHLGGKKGVSEYYEIAPLILKEMRRRDEINYLYVMTTKYLIPCFEILSNDMSDNRAYELYSDMVEHLQKKYLIEKGASHE